MAKKQAREVVLEILLDIEEDKSYINIALRQTIDKYSYLIPKDKNLVTEITNGTIKYQRRIDYIINQFAKTKVKKMEPVIRNTIRMSVYQIMFLDKIPDSAACNEAVKIVKGRNMTGLSGFVNGVLRNIARNKDKIKYPNPDKNPVDYLGIMYSLPNWIVKYWLESYSYEEVEKICKSLNDVPEITIRTNTNKISRMDLQSNLQKEAVNVSNGYVYDKALVIKPDKPIYELKSFKEGLFTVQGETSMLTSNVVAPRPGDLVLDVCAAPGGKTTHLAELMHNEGQIIAADIYPHKLDLINENAGRLGHTIIKTTIQDAAKLNKDYIGKFDKILVDAPCSGLGIINKKSDIRWSKDFKDILSLQKLQKQILEVTSQYLKPNGVLVYSTCTISTKENEDVFNWAIDNLKLSADNIHAYLPAPIRNDKDKRGYVQIMPYEYNLDGFFISRLRKRG